LWLFRLIRPISGQQICRITQTELNTILTDGE
jgi:hypothetical protein